MVTAIVPSVTKPTQAQVVLVASRALVAVAAKSLAQIEDVVTAMQWRVLVVVSRQRQLALNELAGTLGVHPSTGTRLCDQLVAKNLLSRRDDPADRRFLVLSLTAAGEELVRRVNRERETDIDAILSRLPVRTRKTLVAALNDFAEAAGELTVDPFWDLASSQTKADVS